MIFYVLMKLIVKTLFKLIGRKNQMMSYNYFVNKYLNIIFSPHFFKPFFLETDNNISTWQSNPPSTKGFNLIISQPPFLKNFFSH